MISRRRLGSFWIYCFSVLSLSAGILTSLATAGPAYTDPAKADDDFGVQGEYSGIVKGDKQDVKVGVQVIALGEGKFRAVAYPGGLPGDGWDPSKEKHSVDGQREEDTVTFQGDKGRGVIKDGVLMIYSQDGVRVGELNKVNRTSPTLGKEPPKDAVVLFNGEDTDQWQGGKMTEDRLLMPGTTSKPTFQDHQIHVEFRLPYQPQDRGQARGNSGIYVQGRYECQMLDSFGLEGKHNECGGLYSVKDPDVNMCFPPLSWQTYDIDYRAARFDDDGKLTANPRVTVRHNGVVIHDDVELPGERSTTAAPSKPGSQAGPVYLQDHGNPVRYRNIWVVPTNQE